MDFEKIKELIQLVNDSKIAFFELTDGNESIKMDKSFNRDLKFNNTNSCSELEINRGNMGDNLLINEGNTQEKLIDTIDEESAIAKEDIKVITSPMVGTFYASASPTSDPFVKPGDKVSNGTVLCIIEAMKLMNEIESECTGTIVECLVNDGDMVEYEQPLFKYKED